MLRTLVIECSVSVYVHFNHLLLSPSNSDKIVQITSLVVLLNYLLPMATISSFAHCEKYGCQVLDNYSVCFRSFWLFGIFTDLDDHYYNVTIISLIVRNL